MSATRHIKNSNVDLLLQQELNSLGIDSPLELLTNHPPCRISLSSLANWIPIAVGHDILTVKLECPFKLRTSIVNGSHMFVYASPDGQILQSSSPFSIIRKVCRQYYPLVTPANKGWSYICYLGRTLVWWRRQYLISYIASAIQSLSPKILAVGLTTPSLKLATDIPINHGVRVGNLSIITFTAHVETEEDKTAIQKIYTFLQVSIETLSIKDENSLV